MCFMCHELGHLAYTCPNKEKLKFKKEEERLKHVKCFKYHDWGHLTLSCPTKQLVKQQEKLQPKPQVEQEKAPQDQVKINHENQVDNLKMKKKRTRRGGKKSKASHAYSRCQDDEQEKDSREDKGGCSHQVP